MGGIAPFEVMELLARARQLEAQGRDIVHMEVGEPDFTAPPRVVEAGMAAIQAGQTLYTPALGLPQLREAIARHYADRYNVTISPERVVVTPGASGALLIALGLLLDPDDGLLLADPGYPCNRHFARFLNARAEPVAVGASSAYQLTAQHVRDHWGAKTRAALIATPSNPTGTRVSEAELVAMGEAVAQRGGHLLVDEIYQGLVYGCEPTTALALRDDLFVINSFSKYFCMTGWRLGWLVLPEAYLRGAEKLMQNLFLAASTPAQYAALAAFEPETLALLEQRRAQFRARRDFLLPALRELGFQVPVTPEGAFYLYADASAHTDDSFAFAGRLLEEAGVAVTPGRDFGSHRPQAHLRFAYTTSLERIEEGVGRLRRFLGR